MTRIEIMQCLLGASKTRERISVSYRNEKGDLENITGIVDSFNGVLVNIDGQEIAFQNIETVELYAKETPQEMGAYEEDVLLSYVGQRIGLTIVQDDITKSVDGIVFAVENGMIQFVTDEGLSLLAVANVKHITAYDETVKDDTGKSNAVKNDTELSDTVKNNTKDVIYNREELAGFSLNSFEEALIDGNKNQVEAYIDNSETLAEMGYSEKEITRIINARDTIKWENSNYGIACRLNSMQLNKKRLAEYFYEKTLEETADMSAKMKLLNTLAMLYIKEDSEKYIAFFNTYRNQLIQNSNYCGGYADCLKKLGMWDELQEFLPVYEEKCPNAVQKLAEYKSHISFAKRAENIDIQPVKNAIVEFEKEDLFVEIEQINQLKNSREAYQRLLLYCKNLGNEAAFFALAELFLFDIVLHKDQMELMRTMLLRTKNETYVNRFLPKLPVFWCDEEIMARFTYAGEETAAWIQEYLLWQKQLVTEYPPLNVLETCIVNADYDTLRDLISDTDKLYQLGYVESEIEYMQHIDLQQYEQLGEKICTAIRLLDFERNKNHAAERFLYEGIYEDAVGIGSRLYPILLQENRNAFVTALYTFNPEIQNQQVNQERYYLSALCEVASDEEFWQVSKERWQNNNDEKVLRRLKELADKKGESALSVKLSAMLKARSVSPLELAMLEADAVKMREYINQPDVLVSFGYTPEEIRRLQDILDKPYGKGMDNIDIARRFYIFQKNRNRLTETYYMMALEEEPLQASDGLFRIYADEECWEKVCLIYEQNLAKEYEGKHNLYYDKLYGRALFETKQYDKFYHNWKTNYYMDESYPLYQQLMLVMELENITEDKEAVANLAIKDGLKAEIAYNMILAIMQKKKLAEVKELVCRLFNAAFQGFNAQQLQALTPMFVQEDVSLLPAPEGNGICCLVQEDEAMLQEWYDYLMKDKERYDRIEFIGKLAYVYPESASCFAQTMLQLYEGIIATGGSGNLYNALVNVLVKVLEKKEDQYAWLALTKKRETIDHRTLNLCAKYCAEAELWDDMLFFVRKACINISSENARTNIFKVVMEICSALAQRNELQLLKEAIDCVELIWTKQQASSENCSLLYRFYAQADMKDKAFMMDQAIQNMLWWESEKSDTAVTEFEKIADTYRPAYTESSIFEMLKKELDKSDVASVDRFCSYWSKFIQPDSRDKECLRELQNSTTERLQLDVQTEDALAKMIISGEEPEKNWKLLRKTLENPTEQMQCNVGYHLALYTGAGMEQEMERAMNADLAETTFYIVQHSMESLVSEQIIGSQKMLGRIKAEKPEWYQLDAVRAMLADILHNMQATLQLSTEAQAWNTVHTAVEIALFTDNVEVFVKEFENYLTNVDAKHCGYLLCKLLLQNYDRAMIDKLAECLMKNHREAPYTALVLDMYHKTQQTELEETDRMLLEFALVGKGNLAGVAGMLSFYYDAVKTGKAQLALEVTILLQKYFPEDAIIYELEYFFRDTIDKDTDDGIERLYHIIFKYMGMITEVSYYDILVRRLLYGEKYLEWIGRPLPENMSIISIAKSRNDLPFTRSNLAFISNTERDLKDTANKELLGCIYKAFFTRDWTPLFTYKPVMTGDELVYEQIHFYGMMMGREVEFVKSAVAHLISGHATQESRAAIENFWEHKEVFSMSYKQFEEEVLSWNSTQKESASYLWNISFENKDICGRGLFGTMLMEKEEYHFLIPILKVVKPKSRRFLFPYEREDKGASEATEEIVETKKPYEMDLTPESVEKALGVLALNRKYLKEHMEQFGLKDRSIESLATIEFRNRAKIMRSAALYFNMCVLYDKEPDAEVFSYIGYVDFINVITQAAIETVRCGYLPAFIYKMGEKFHLAGRCIILTMRGNDARNIGLIEQAILETEYIEDDELRNAVYYAIYVLTRYKYTSISNMAYNKTTSDLEYPILTPRTISYMLHQLDVDCFATKNKIRKDTQMKKVEESVTPVSVSDCLACIFVQEALAKAGEEKLSSYVRLPGNIASYAFEDAEKEYISRISYLAEHAAQLDAYKEKQCRNLCVELGILYLHHEEILNEKTLTEVLSMVDAGYYLESVLLGYLIQAIQKYYVSFDDIDTLCASFRKNRYTLERIGFLQNSQLDEWNNVNIQYICDLQEIISILDESMVLQDGDALQVSVDKCMNMLQRKKNLQSVEKIRMHLIHLLTKKNVSIQSVPKLKIYFDEDETGEKQKWLPEKEDGQLSGYIHNIGGIEALDVKVQCNINGSRETVFGIDKVYVNEKLPFAVAISEEDIIDGKVSWTVNVVYFDSAGHEISQMKKRDVEIVFCEGDINYGSMITNEIISGEGFVGRQMELRKMKSQMNIRPDGIDDLTSICVKGLRRMGKSSIVEQLIKTELSKYEDRLFIVNVSGQEILDDISKPFVKRVLYDAKEYLYEGKLLELINAGKEEEAIQLVEGEFATFTNEWEAKIKDGTWIEDLSMLYKELSRKYLEGRHILLVLDEMEKIFFAEKDLENTFKSVEQQKLFFGVFRTLVQRTDNPISFIIIGSDKFLSTSLMENQNEVTQVFQNLGSIEIGRMNKADIEEVYRLYSEKSDITFSKEAIERIWEYTNGLIWYAKLLGDRVKNSILPEEMTLRTRVTLMDIQRGLEMFLEKEKDKYSLLMLNLDIRQKSILRAMALAMPDRNEPVSVARIESNIDTVRQAGYMDTKGVEWINMNEDEIAEQLNFLEEMGFVEKIKGSKLYQFAAELYRIFIQKEKVVRKLQELES